MLFSATFTAFLIFLMLLSAKFVCVQRSIFIQMESDVIKVVVEWSKTGEVDRILGMVTFDFAFLKSLPITVTGRQIHLAVLVRNSLFITYLPNLFSPFVNRLSDNLILSSDRTKCAICVFFPLRKALTVLVTRVLLFSSVMLINQLQ